MISTVTMQISFTPEDAMKIFHSALVDGRTMLPSSGLRFDYANKEYARSRNKIKDTDPCYEDVLVQMLHDGYKLTIVDIEGDGEYTRSITIGDVVANLPITPAKWLVEIIDGTGDALTAFEILQHVFFKESVFG